MYMYLCIYMYVHVYVYLYVCTCVYLYMYVCMYMGKYVYMYIISYVFAKQSLVTYELGDPQLDNNHCHIWKLGTHKQEYYSMTTHVTAFYWEEPWQPLVTKIHTVTIS